LPAFELITDSVITDYLPSAEEDDVGLTPGTLDK
jgi:hypothetical protein